MMTFHEALERLRAAVSEDFGLACSSADATAWYAKVARLAADLCDAIPAPPSEDARAYVAHVSGGADGCGDCSGMLCVDGGMWDCSATGKCAGVVIDDGGVHVYPDLRGPGCPWYEEKRKEGAK